MAETVAVVFVKIFGSLYDVITLPVYSIWQKPWRKWPLRSMVYSVSKSGVPEGPYETTRAPAEHDHLVSGIRSIDELFQRAVTKGGTRAMLGTREVLGEMNNVQSNGKSIRKINFGAYNWSSFEEVNRRVKYLAVAYRQLGLRAKSRICILAETRQEWLLSALAAFKSNITVVTLYANLGEKGLITGLSESQAAVVIISEDLLDVVLKNSSQLRHIKYLIYLASGTLSKNKSAPPSSLSPQITVYSFNDFELIGRQPSTDVFPGPLSDDVAIIMYTSGSGGNPKGVELTHANILCAIRGFMVVVDEEIVGGTYVAYLPLAHIFEIAMELTSLCLGMRIGYSSPLTLTDNSLAIAEGQQGDLSVLKPHMMAMVPLVLERLKKYLVSEKISPRGKVFRRLFDYAISYKTFWMRLGFETPLLDAVLFDEMKAILGGNLRRIIIGSARVSEDSHVFARACLCRNILCGYGMTETAAVISIQLPGAFTPSVCGAPMRNIYVRLEPWPEGGYDPQDKPRPRGEILAGGGVVTKAYLNNPELTKEATVELDGIRYFRTGDIGEITEQGEIRIIDRKKDLFKGPTGEYIALAKVEADLKTCVLVDNICVYGDPSSGNLVAIIVPDRVELQKLANRFRISGTTTELCENLTVKHEVTAVLKRECVSKQLSKRETPSAVVLTSEIWSPETGFVTASMKICRKPIYKYYQQRIQSELGALYRSSS